MRQTIPHRPARASTDRESDTLVQYHRGLVLALIFGFLLFGWARGHAQGEQAGVAPGQILSGGHARSALHTDVTIRVFGMLAEVQVVQHFASTADEVSDAQYQFPLPDQAAVNRLRMTVGEQVIEGEIHERRAAEKVYAAAREAGHTASLVSVERADLFQVNVANLAPGEAIAVELSYVQALTYRDDGFTLRFPLAHQARYNDREAQPVVGRSDVSLRVELEPGFELSRLESRYHEIVTVRQGRRQLVELVAGVVERAHDFELVWEPTLADQPQAAVFAQRYEGQDYALVMVLPPSSVYKSAAPRELILVIDSSGSMGGQSLPQAAESLIMALGALRPEDRFNVIDFDSSARALFAQAVDATDANIGHAITFVDGLVADGGTQIGRALELALSGEAPPGFVRQVVFITDGAVGETGALLRQIEDQLGSSRLFTVGIGAAPNAHFMRKAAAVGRGTYTFVGALNEVDEKMDSLLTRIEHPVLTDTCAQWPGLAEFYPQRLPDLYRGEALVVAARLDEAKGAVTLCGKREDQDWFTELQLDRNQSGFAVASLWAQRRVETLLDELEHGADPQWTRAEVVATALHHRVASPYTSFVAVDRSRQLARPNRPARTANLSLSTDAGTVFRITLGLFLLALGFIFRARLRDD